MLELTPEEKCSKAQEIIASWVEGQKGQEACWYFPQIFRALADLFDVKCDYPYYNDLPPEKEFKAGCCQFQDELYKHCRVMSREEIITSIDKSSRKRFGMSASEFVHAWQTLNGEGEDVIDLVCLLDLLPENDPIYKENK